MINQQGGSPAYAKPVRRVFGRLAVTVPLVLATAGSMIFVGGTTSAQQAHATDQVNAQRITNDSALTRPIDAGAAKKKINRRSKPLRS